MDNGSLATLKAAYDHDLENHWRSKEELDKKYQWVLERAEQYARKCNTTKEAVIAAWETKRDYWWLNYYQECEQPSLDGKASVMTTDEWRQEATRRFGPDKLDWKFKCPACGHIQTPRDFKDGGKEPERAATCCASRFGLGGSKTCKWTTGGFLKFNATYVIDDEFCPHLVFDFADAETK